MGKGEAHCGDIRSRYEGMIWRSVQKQTHEDYQKNKKRVGMSGSDSKPVVLLERFCRYDAAEYGGGIFGDPDVCRSISNCAGRL
jgi:hypothetical protein